MKGRTRSTRRSRDALDFGNEPDRGAEARRVVTQPALHDDLMEQICGPREYASGMEARESHIAAFAKGPIARSMSNGACRNMMRPQGVHAWNEVEPPLWKMLAED